MYRCIAGREAGSNVGAGVAVGRVDVVMVDVSERRVLWYTVNIALRSDCFASASYRVKGTGY